MTSEYLIDHFCTVVKKSEKVRMKSTRKFQFTAPLIQDETQKDLQQLIPSVS